MKTMMNEKGIRIYQIIAVKLLTVHIGVGLKGRKNFFGVRKYKNSKTFQAIVNNCGIGIMLNKYR